MAFVGTSRSMMKLLQFVKVLSGMGSGTICRRTICLSATRPLPLLESAEQDKQKYSISSEFVNRNPRNLELLGIAHKREGWKFQAPRKDFYHKVIFERERRQTVAKLVHTSGSLIVTASTKESAISKHLSSNSDVNAAYNIGRVFAHRCHQAGIDTMMFEQLEEGETVMTFVRALEENGITLEEIESNPYAEHEIGIDYDNKQ